jgi:hypothetical protein
VLAPNNNAASNAGPIAGVHRMRGVPSMLAARAAGAFCWMGGQAHDAGGGRTRSNRPAWVAARRRMRGSRREHACIGGHRLLRRSAAFGATSACFRFRSRAECSAATGRPPRAWSLRQRLLQPRMRGLRLFMRAEGEGVGMVAQQARSEKPNPPRLPAAG